MTTLLLIVLAFLLGVWCEDKHFVTWRLDDLVERLADRF